MGQYKKNRRKSNDNPYNLEYNEVSNKYHVIFKDNKRNINKIEVSKNVFFAFDSFELEDISQMHKYERHIEQSEMFEETLYHRSINKPASVEEEVEEKLLHNDLKNALDKLSVVQKRRIRKYYFENMTLKKIAEEENCSIMSVKESIDSGISKLKKILKK
ncbi:MAG: sigma-70 family RNA polymerase sigma factor [bacterium]|nr:sigma-70 family RNA polymerase sigma factor [bacterium]